MANAYPAKVGRTVQVLASIGGVVRWRPGVITAVTDADTATIRVGRQDHITNGTGNPPPDGIPDEIYTAIDRRVGNAKVLNTWRPG